MNRETLTEKFSDIINNFPKNIAVTKPDCYWNYQELDQAIRVVQQQLRERNFAPQSVIGLLISDPLWLAASIWAVIRERLIYVVLDVTYPQERLSYQLQDCQAAMLMVDVESSWLHQELINSISSHLINFEESPLLQEIAYLHTCQPEDLITLYYTSGSTGKPKGVMHNHLTILHEVRVHTATLEIIPDDRFSALYSLATIGSNRDFYVALLNGASWNFVPFRSLGLIALKNWIQSQKLTILHAIPLVFRELNHTSSSENCFESVRVVFVAGDRVLPDDIRLFRQNFSSKARFYTGIGASEASSIYTHWFIPEEDPLDYPLLPSGYPLPEKEVFLVNDKQEKISQNEEGEIAVCSHYLSPGYFGKAELTQQAFEERESGLRVYFTGDNGRFDEQGRLVFIGRKDEQVKINGFRVELGEIEAILRQHPHVLNVVAIVRENISGDKRLIAYIVLQPQAILTKTELRQLLKQKLPDYMIPSAFVFLEKFPLTPNGKIDRRALPTPDLTRQDPEDGFVYPHDELELQLTKIWEKVLVCKPISVRDNFSDLGGHSLLAVKLFAEIEKSFQINLPLSTLFQAPTVEELAKFLRHEKEIPGWYSFVPIQSAGSRPILFVIYHHIYFKDLTRHLGHEQPIYALHYGIAEATDGVLSLPKMEDLAAHYIEEMRTLQPEGPYFLIGLHCGGVVAYEMAQQLIAQGQQVGLLASLNTHIKLPLRLRLSNLSRLTPAEWLERVKKRVEMKLHVLRHGNQDQRNIYRIINAYTPKAYPGRVNLFKTMDTDYAKEGWRKLVTGELEIHEIPGTHVDILEEPNVQILATKLRVCVDKALVELL